MLGGKLRCKGVQKSPLLPTVSSQGEAEACPELLPVETAVQPLGPGILQIDWDVFD